MSKRESLRTDMFSSVGRQTVLTVYGWDTENPFRLGHDLVTVETLPENDRTRFTITPTARKELLTRLLTENHKRAAAEATAPQFMPAKTKASHPKAFPSQPELLL